jgi:hypothetical protein
LARNLHGEQKPENTAEATAGNTVGRNKREKMFEERPHSPKEVLLVSFVFCGCFALPMVLSASYIALFYL